jgi:hypothetical protein
VQGPAPLAVPGDPRGHQVGHAVAGVDRARERPHLGVGPHGLGRAALQAVGQEPPVAVHLEHERAEVEQHRLAAPAQDPQPAAHLAAFHERRCHGRGG